MLMLMLLLTLPQPAAAAGPPTGWADSCACRLGGTRAQGDAEVG